jgi:hypothetical protein
MFIFVLFISLAFAEAPEIRSLMETTYTRDNTYCQFGKQRVQIQIRGVASHTEPNEKNYGELMVIYPEDTPKVLPINQDKLHTYRLFNGKSALCSKSVGYTIGKDKVAVLFLKENRPFMDKLTFQIIDIKTLLPEAVVESDYGSDLTEIAPDGFYFRTQEERTLGAMGKLTIQDVPYTYQDRNFSYWVKYSAKGFEISAPLSFQNFQWKSHFKDENDFFEASGWDKTEMKFKNTFLSIAVNHSLKKECILLSAQIIKPDGSEPGWRCN